jgi:uncharacterized protein YecA (UPF0149 family)
VVICYGGDLNILGDDKEHLRGLSMKYGEGLAANYFAANYDDGSWTERAAIQHKVARSLRGLTMVVLATCFLSGCQTAYYTTMEKFGIEKRDILVDRVEDAREAQTEASEQFESALEAFTTLTDYDGADLAEQYQTLKKSFEKSQSRAEEVTERIDSVERVGQDLLKEWAQEIEQYTNQSLKSTSQTQLNQTQVRFQQLVSAMRSAESRMPPVLSAFQDRVLFLKHNLNARALTALRGDVAAVESDVGALISEMRRSIREADAFIAEMR